MRLDPQLEERLSGLPKPLRSVTEPIGYTVYLGITAGELTLFLNLPQMKNLVN